MARIEVKGMQELAQMLDRLGDAGDAIGKMAVYEGAAVVADEVRSQVEALPVDRDRMLAAGEKFDVITKRDKNDLLGSLGIKTIDRDEKGIRTVVGFNGYGTRRTKAYPGGLPMPMLARSIEHGSSVRQARPFMKAAAAKARPSAKAAMIKMAEEKIAETIRTKS